MRWSVLLLLATAGCEASREAPTSTYFDRTIAPTLRGSCVQLTTGCHIETKKGSALGNLDVTTFAALDRRRDLLGTYGPYPLPGLLMKVVEKQALRIEGPTGTVTVWSDKVVLHAGPTGEVVLEVHDTGTGMSEAVQAQLFTPFFTTKPVGIGTGLGLSISKRLVSEMHGSIELASALGTGTIMRVRLPAARKQHS